MPKKEHLLVTCDFHSETVRKLDALYHTHHLWRLSPSEKSSLLTQLQGKCRAAAVAAWFVDEKVYELESIELISSFGVGLDVIDFQRTNAKNIRVTNTPDVLNDSVADVAMSLVLATTRNIINADRFARSGNWSNSSFPFCRSIGGMTLGIIGLGRIGEEIAQRAIPFNMKIAYHNRREKNLAYTYYPTLTGLAKESDVLICALPGGEETKQAINKDIFQALGSAGVFINIGRGSCVDETALIEALANNTIAAAGLDVYENEPNIPEALISMDNVVLFPHIGSSTVETRHAMGNLMLDNLAAFFANKPLLTEID
jgi:hydroxypyruvate reductase